MSNRSSSSNTTEDNRVVAGPGGLAISSGDDGQIFVDFKDDNAINAAREAAAGAIVSGQDATRLALQLARTAQGDQQLFRLAVAAGAMIGITYLVTRSAAA